MFGVTSNSSLLRDVNNVNEENSKLSEQIKNDEKPVEIDVPFTVKVIQKTYNSEVEGKSVENISEAIIKSVDLQDQNETEKSTPSTSATPDEDKETSTPKKATIPEEGIDSQGPTNSRSYAKETSTSKKAVIPDEQVDSQMPTNSRSYPTPKKASSTEKHVLKRLSDRITTQRRNVTEEVDSAARPSSQKKSQKKRMIALFLESEYPRKK